MALCGNRRLRGWEPDRGWEPEPELVRPRPETETEVVAKTQTVLVGGGTDSGGGLGSGASRPAKTGAARAGRWRGQDWLRWLGRGAGRAAAPEDGARTTLASLHMQLLHVEFARVPSCRQKGGTDCCLTECQYVDQW